MSAIFKAKRTESGQEYIEIKKGDKRLKALVSAAFNTEEDDIEVDEITQL